MITRWNNLYERLRSSLWLVPSLLAVSAGLAAEIALHIDLWLLRENYTPPFLYPGNIAGARQVLGTLAASMVSLTTISFSVMMVVLTLASNQFGPRVLRNFLSDRFYQVVLGIFVATFAYSLFVLGRLPDVDDPGSAVPRFAVTFALVMTFTSLATLIGFIHHVARSVQASQIVQQAHREACRTILAVYPDALGQDQFDETPIPREDYASNITLEVRADRAGYVQAISVDDVMSFAVENDIVVEFHIKPGHFISTRSLLATLHGKLPADEKPTRERIRSAVLLGSERTGEQDAQYGVRQLMEIGIRSLSPGINDPVTAISCIDYLCEDLAELARRILPPEQRYDENGQLRVVVRRDDFADIASAAFDNLRHYGRSHPEVMNRLAVGLAMIAGEVHREPDRQWMRAALRDLRAEAENLPHQTDRKRFDACCAEAASTLDRSS
ncbi:DUF2254 domain-containing protein [Synoicihabitans lomoniglobus]|uniref:DUF2254 domain-containing protein n=1 Tax=Synoicihabitans lomoniglobus TaxID=2909285 RepID=A0AAF0CNA9_9BACT|nr:DUF2254 domain-containing protein [Opitutaceae bacterium LMO-M01]WED65268.1 DUF2254 domain-containing protein [Opitutaceae bacterium LMO-M01]